MPYGTPRSGDERIARHELTYECKNCTPPERQYQNQEVFKPLDVKISITKVAPDEAKPEDSIIETTVMVSDVQWPLEAIIRVEIEDEDGEKHYSGEHSVPNGEQTLNVSVPLSGYNEGDYASLTVRIQEKDGFWWTTEDTEIHSILVTETPAQPPVFEEFEQYIEPAMWGAGAGAIVGMIMGGKTAMLEFAGLGAVAYAGYKYLTKPAELY